MTGAYGDVGFRDVEAAVTPERVRSAVRAVAGETLDVGPLPVGPGGLALARVTGVLRGVAVERDDVDGRVGYRALMDLRLDLDVLAGGHHHGFEVLLDLPLRVTATAVSGSNVQTVVDAPHPDDLTARVRPRGLRARALAALADVEGTVRRQAATHLAERLARPGAWAALLHPLRGEA